MSLLPRRRRRDTLPVLGPAVPVLALPVAAGLVGGALVLAQLPSPYRYVAAPLAVVVALRPDPVTSGAVVLLLALHQGVQPLVPVHPGFFVLLAGAHLLHLLTSLCQAVPRRGWLRGWLQLAALRRPLARYAAIQVPVQVLAVLVLTLVAGSSGGLAGRTAPVLGTLGALALLAAALLLVRPLLRRPPS